MADVFISYSRRDKEFALVLYDALRASQYDIWVDWEDIAITTDWWKEIEEAIEAAHTFIFVISQDSIASKYCRREIDYALEHDKRLIPVLLRKDFTREDSPPGLWQRQWISFQPDDDFDSAFATLVKAIGKPQLTLTKRQSRNQCYDEVLADRVVPLRMMQIPAGTFLMGSPEDELERRDNEGPQYEVTLSQFFMGKYPITQAQWRAVAALPQVDRKLMADPSRFKGDLRPVEQVSWYDAVEFCDRLTILTNRQYRLPTEAEWEYACRAGTKTPFYFGETITTELANYRGTDNESVGWSGSYGDGPKGEYRQETTPVNQFEGANAFGLCDMHGNVWEWCQDHWHGSYEGAPGDGSAWIAGSDSKRRVRRGGSFNNFPSLCRSTYRNDYETDIGDFTFGFRVCCSAPRSLQPPL